MRRVLQTRALSIVLAFACALCLSVELRDRNAANAAQQYEVPVASLTSVSTIAVCSQEFGTYTELDNTTTNQLCGTATNSEMSILSFNVQPGEDASPVSLLFESFPPAPADSQSGAKYDRSQPCSAVRRGKSCTTFANAPLKVGVTSSAVAVTYSLTPITDKFPFVYLDYASIAKWDVDDEENQEDGDIWTADSLLNPDPTNQYFACAVGAEVNYQGQVRTLFGGMHSTNGGNYQYDGGCEAYQGASHNGYNSWSLPYCYYHPDKCKRTINAQAWCIQRLSGVNNGGTLTPDANPQLSGFCSPSITTARSYTGKEEWYPMSSLRRDWFGCLANSGNCEKQSADIEGGVCNVCRAEYTDSAYMAGMFGHERKCNTFMQDFRQCYLESMDKLVFSDSGGVQTVHCTSWSADAKTCTAQNNFTNTADKNYKICLDSPVQDGGVNSEKSCSLFLPTQQCDQLMGNCGPGTLQTACFGSYNQPEDFYDTSTASSSDTTEQGILGKRGVSRGAAITPYWLHTASSSTGANPSDWNKAHLYRCGHFCNSMPIIDNYAANNALNGEGRFYSGQNLGYVKGWVGLGPFCRAYQVQRRGRVKASVTFTVGQNEADTSTLSVSTDDTGTGSAVSYDENVKGVAARLLGPGTTTGRVTNDVSGVLVVCGAEPVASTETASYIPTPGSINGALGPRWDVNDNPWPTLTKAVDAVQDPVNGLGVSGVTGACTNGCPMPVTPLITALQCFRCSTASMAPWQVCYYLHKVCKEVMPHSGCEVPFDFTLKGGVDGTVSDGLLSAKCNDRASSGYDTDFATAWGEGASCQQGTTDAQCTANKQTPRGVSWMWYPESQRAAFGSGCGQYGMNPWKFGLSEGIGQYVCTRPGAQVPCVPGRSVDAPTVGVKPPCSVLGGMTKFYCATSSGKNPSNFAYAEGACPKLEGNGCDKNSDVAQPAGVPPGWVRGKPNFWVHMGKLYTKPLQTSTLSMAVDLYVNQFALNADVQNISPGKLVTAAGVSCILVKGSTNGYSTVGVQNTGPLTAGYIVRFVQCYGAKGQRDVGVVDNTDRRVSVTPGNVSTVTFDLSTSKGVSFSQTTCKYELYPQARASLLLDTRQFGCAVTLPPKQNAPGSNALPSLSGNGADYGPNTCNAPRVICWFYYGSLFSQISFIVLVSLVAAVSIYFIILVVRVSYAESRVNTQRNAAQQAKSTAREADIAIQEKLEHEELEARKQQDLALARSQQAALPGTIAKGLESAVADIAKRRRSENPPTTSASAIDRDEVY